MLWSEDSPLTQQSPRPPGRRSSGRAPGFSLAPTVSLRAVFDLSSEVHVFKAWGAAAAGLPTHTRTSGPRPRGALADEDGASFQARCSRHHLCSASLPTCPVGTHPLDLSHRSSSACRGHPWGPHALEDRVCILQPKGIRFVQGPEHRPLCVSGG